jgi:hypothetical protein
MYISENRFNIAFHKREAWKYDLCFKTTRLLFIIVMLISIFYFKPWLFLSALLIELFLYLFAVKMRTLRDVNLFAAQKFKQIYKKEIGEMFK